MAETEVEIRQIRCSNCGRFLGVGYIIEGEVYLKCKNCKQWTVVLGKSAEANLTGQDLCNRILATGQKVRKVQVPTK
jgi:ribosomal protein S27E